VATPLEHGLRFAGTVELGGLNAAPDYARARIIAERGRRMLPGLNEAGGVPWMGFRPSMPDSLPVIDRSGKHPNVFFGFGHGHLGLTLAAVTGREVVVPANPGAMGAWGITLCAAEAIGADRLAASPGLDLTAVLAAEVTERAGFRCQDKKCATLCTIDRTTVVVGDRREVVFSGGACPKYELAGVGKVKLPSEHIEQAEAKKVYDKVGIPKGTLAERVKHVIQSAFNGTRIVIFSGGAKKESDEAVFDEARAIRDGGGFGSIIGRNAFQRPKDHALKFLGTIMDIYAGKLK